MYSIDLRVLRLDFEAAIMAIPRDGTSYDWLNEDWIDTPQAIEIIQADASAVVIGMPGRYGLKGVHLVEILPPRIYVEDDLVKHLLSQSHVGIPAEVVQKS
jgi:hypothetical protein